MSVTATGVAILSCKLRTHPDADPGFARPGAGKLPTVLAAAAKRVRTHRWTRPPSMRERPEWMRGEASVPRLGSFSTRSTASKPNSIRLPPSQNPKLA